MFKTREDYLSMGMPRVLQVLRLLKEFPEYTFTLDQVCLIKPFLERYPEEAPAFRKFVAEGRLGIVGGMDVMPDVVKPGGEMFVRQMQYGKRYCRKELGVDVTTAWLLDTFGHHPQMPQLLTAGRLQVVLVLPRCGAPGNARGVSLAGYRRHADSAFWLPFSYGLFYGPPRKFPEFSKFFQKQFDSLNLYVRSAERVGLAGVDVSEPEDHVPPLVAEFNRQPDAPFLIRQAVPAAFEAVVERRTNQPVVTAELSPIFQGTYSSRIELKQTTRELEQRLLTAEKLSAIASWLGTPADDAMLWRAWEPVMFNQTHDLSSGVMTDVVYDDTVRSFGFSKRLTDEVIEGRWESIAARIDTRGEGIPVVVFNTLSWPRTDVAEVELGLGEGGVRDIGLVDPPGRRSRSNSSKLSITATAQSSGPGSRSWRSDVPALGYAVYHARPQRSAAAAQPEAKDDKPRDFIENEHYRATFNLDTGAITSLLDKSARWEVLAGPGRHRPRTGQRRFVGIVSWPRWRQPHRHDQPAACAPAGLGAVQQRAVGNERSRSRWPGVLRVQRGAPFRQRQFRHTRPTLCRPAPPRHPNGTGEQREIRALPGPVPDFDPEWAKRRGNPVWGR